MAKIRFKNGIVEDYTIILANKALQHLGQLTGVSDVKFSANLNSADTISFVVNKPDLIPVADTPDKDIMAYQDYIWENLVDFKTIYVKELKEYFEIRVSIEDGKDTKKSINGTSLCEAELSQTNLYTIEINTESDISREDYKPTTFYNSEDASCSLLHRVLSKVPHYHIGHVDESLCNLQRTFSIDGTAIYDFLVGECAEQFDCLFLFDSETRSVSAYDLKSFGADTTIYVDKNNLTESIHFEMNGDNVKNCFKLEAGDADMTAAVRTLNPNGSDYLYLIREDDRKDMPQELVDKLDAYSKDLLAAEPEIKDITARHRDLTDKLQHYQHAMMPNIEFLESNQTLEDIEDPKEGVIYMYGNLAYLFDGSSFVPQNDYTQFLLELAPTFEAATAGTEAAKLTADVLSPIGLQTLHAQTSLSTVNATIKSYAKVFVKSAYAKLEIEDELTDPNITFDAQKGLWHGRIKVTNLSDKEDVVYTGYMDIQVTSDYQTFLAQKIDKTIKNSDDEEGSVFDVLSIEDMKNFQKALTLYCEDRLISFRDAIGLVIDLLGAKGITQLIEDRDDTKNAELIQLQDALLVPYQAKASACENQLAEIQKKISDLSNAETALKAEREAIQSELNLETRLGELYPIFCSYKREDKYSNSNYISDGLNNTQIIERAEEFWELARQEIDKSANGQYNITSTLYNLLTMEEFQPIVEYFELGNWIRVKVEGEQNLLQLRLIGYEIDFSHLQTIHVTFSTATRVTNLKDERKSILESAKSLATNFGYVSKQAEKGQEANNNMHSIVQNGLDSGVVTIKNNNHEEVTYGNYGILLREYDDILDDYTGNQCKLTHNAMVYTTDHWETASQAIGEHTYTYYDTTTTKLEQAVGYGVTAQFCQSAYIYGGQIVSADIYSEDYNPSTGIGSHIGLRGRGEFQFGNALTFDGENLKIKGELEAGSIISETTIRGSHIDGGTISIGNNFKVDKDGNVTATNVTLTGDINAKEANITGNIYANYLKANEGGSIGGWTIGASKLSAGNVSLKSTGDISGNGWSITNGGAATFSNIKITGGSVNGSTVSASSLNASKMNTDVWNKVEEIAKLKVDELSADEINTKFLQGSGLLNTWFMHTCVLSIYESVELTGVPTIQLDGGTGTINCTTITVAGSTGAKWIEVKGTDGNPHKVLATD